MIDKPHVLVIEDVGDGEKEFRILHLPTCKWEVYKHFHGPWCSEPCERKWDFHRHCLIQWEVENVGLDSLEINSVDGDDHIDYLYVPASQWEPDWHKLKPGRYIVKMTYTWSGSWYDEPDSEFWIDEVA